jgi:hypothetical protein
MCVSPFKGELNLSAPIVYLVFYSSSPYMVGHYRLEVANDIFNNIWYVMSYRPTTLHSVSSVVPCCLVTLSL